MSTLRNTLCQIILFPLFKKMKVGLSDHLTVVCVYVCVCVCVCVSVCLYGHVLMSAYSPLLTSE
jgi:hypothetical protein